MLNEGLVRNELLKLFSKSNSYNQFCSEFSDIYFETIVNNANDFFGSTDVAQLNKNLLESALKRNLKNNISGYYMSLVTLWSGGQFSINSPSSPSNTKISSTVTYTGNPFIISKFKKRNKNQIASELASKLVSHVKTMQGIITEITSVGVTITLPIQIN